MSATLNPIPSAPAPSWDDIEDALAAAREDVLILSVLWEHLCTDERLERIVQPNGAERAILNRAIEHVVGSVTEAYGLRFGHLVPSSKGGADV